MKSNYSEPKIYTGGIPIQSWSKLTKKEKTEALDKEWYIYYSYRHPKTLKLTRQPNIKAGANRYKTKRDRYNFLKVLQRNLSLMLQKGFNPYAYNEELKDAFFQPEKKKEEAPKVTVAVGSNGAVDGQTKEVTTIEEAFSLGLSLKKEILAESSYPKFKSKVNQFQKWLLENGFGLGDDIDRITKKTVIAYLNYVLKKTSPRNRNNSRTDIASLFQLLEDNEMIRENFVSSINVLKSTPKRNKTYTEGQLKELFEILGGDYPVLFLFVKFICYNFLRPIEICRLRAGDIDLEGALLTVDAKSKMRQTMRIPKILLDDLSFIEGLDPSVHLFDREQLGGEWDSSDTSKRDFYTKQFKEVKDRVGLDENFGLYSFRHTFITKAYRNLRKTSAPFKAKSELMEMTRHSSMDALEKYLRTIDAEIPEDYSGYLK